MKNILLNSDTSHTDLEHQSVCLFSQIWLYLLKYLLQLEIRLTCSMGHKDFPNIVSVTAWSNYIAVFLTVIRRCAFFVYFLSACILMSM